MNLSEEIREKLICPITGARLKREGVYLESETDPNIRYPIIGGIPILINERNSFFLIDDFIQKKTTTFDLRPKMIKKIAGKLMPKISVNLKARHNYREMAALLPKNSKILVLGGSIKGEGMEEIYADKSYEIIGSDVSFGPYTTIISDAHDIPFEEKTFDGVTVQAVLEHVLDPHRVVAEIYRVLKPAGIVYAETPFMQPVHMKQYDFTRFTHLGHRWLFRNFEEIKSGPCGGPGMALAKSYCGFLQSFTGSKQIGRAIKIFAHLTSFYFKYFDYYLIDKPGSYDAAAGCFFLGKKSKNRLSDRSLLNSFKGLK